MMLVPWYFFNSLLLMVVADVRLAVSPTQLYSGKTGGHLAIQSASPAVPHLTWLLSDRTHCENPLCPSSDSVAIFLFCYSGTPRNTAIGLSWEVKLSSCICFCFIFFKTKYMTCSSYLLFFFFVYCLFACMHLLVHNFCFYFTAYRGVRFWTWIFLISYFEF